MKIYRLPELAELSLEGDILLGPDELGTDAVSVLYGRIAPNGQPKKVSAGAGRDAVLFVVDGKLKVTQGRHTFDVSAGEAFCIEGLSVACIENTSDREAAYMLSAGRCGSEADSDDAGPVAVESDTPCGTTSSSPTDADALPELDTSGLSALSPDETGLDETEFEITREDSDNPGFDEDR